MYMCIYVYVYMLLVQYSTVVAISCQLPATSNLKTVGVMCCAILGMIGLTSHHITNYKLPTITAKLTTGILG